MQDRWMRRTSGAAGGRGLALAGWPTGYGDDDDDTTDVYTGPGTANVNLNVLGTVDDDPEYTLLSTFEGEQIIECGPSEQGEFVAFHLVTDGELLATDGQLEIHAAGFNTDTGTFASQTLYASEHGGDYWVRIPEKPDATFAWAEGNCFLFVMTAEEDCKSPDVPYCGNFSCGTTEFPLTGGTGDTVRMTGSFNCHD